MSIQVTAAPACAKCNGTGEKPYASMHPMCSECYGTGRAGVTMNDLEEQSALKRELRDREAIEADARAERGGYAEGRGR